MAIEIVLVQYHHKGEPDLFEPHVICDMCDGRIMDAEEGNMCWRFVPGTTRMTPVFVHKGACDKKHEADNGFHMWSPLTDFLEQLAFNTKSPA